MRCVHGQASGILTAINDIKAVNDMLLFASWCLIRQSEGYRHE
jgi:hypothetical protein